MGGLTDRQARPYVNMPSRVWTSLDGQIDTSVMDLYMAIHHYFGRYLAVFLECQWTCILTDGHMDKQRNLFLTMILSLIILNLCLYVIHFHFSAPDSNLVTGVETK